MNTWPTPAPQPEPQRPIPMGSEHDQHMQASFEVVNDDGKVVPLVFLGHCYVCALAASQNAGSEVKAATMLVKGTGVCNEHLTHIANADLLSRLPY